MLLRNTIQIDSFVEQKQSYLFDNGIRFYIVPNRHLYDTNNRETMPVVGKVTAVGEGVETSLIGKYVVVHHNAIFNPECLIKEEGGVNTSVLPYDRWIMGWIDEDGDLMALNKNVICERIDVKMIDDVPDASRKTEENLMLVLHSGMDKICRNDKIIVPKYADYEVVYMWENELRRQIVVAGRDVLGRYVQGAHNKYGYDSAGKSYAIERINYTYMTPIHDRVIIKQDTAPEEASGFVVPGTADIKTLSGTVIAVGPGEFAKETGVLIPMQCKVGDKVNFGKNAGTKVFVDGEEYLVMFEREVLLVTNNGLSQNNFEVSLKYLTLFKDGTIKCNHPMVLTAYQYGGVSFDNADITVYVGLVLLGGERKEFKGIGQRPLVGALELASEYLHGLKINN